MIPTKKLENLVRNLKKNQSKPIRSNEPIAVSAWHRFHEKTKLIGDFFVIWKNLLLNLTIVIVAATFIIVLLKTVASRSVTIKPIPVPKTLSAHGFTEKVFAIRVAAKLAEISKVAVSERRRVPRLPVVLIDDKPDIQIPGESVSFQTIVSYLKEAFGLQDVQVSADVTEEDKNFVAQIRIVGGTGSGGQAMTVSPNSANIDAFVQQIAMEAMRLFSPELLASYKLSVAVTQCHGSKECDASEALSLFNELLSHSEKSDAVYLWALKGKANTLQEMGRDDEALDYVQRILTVENQDTDALLVWANALAHQNQLDQAIEKYNQVLKIDPFSTAANINLGIAYKKQCRLDDALSRYDQALKFNPRSVGAHYNRAIVLYAKSKASENAACPHVSAPPLMDAEKEKMRKRAIDEYKLALEIDPTYVAAYQNLGVIYSDMNKPNKAIEQYQSAINVDPTYARPYKNIGDIWLANGKQQEAAAMLKKAIQLKPNYSEAYESWAKLLEKEGNSNEAKNKKEYAEMLKNKAQQKPASEN